MTPANVSVRKVNNTLLRPTEEDEHNDDPKLLDLVAKSAFLKVDERTMKAFRE